ncbi:MAG: hypothetical protein Q4P33_00140 [Flaviflexus sp.]|nr:hypothetical protein [Flaviflexus sp.]
MIAMSTDGSGAPKARMMVAAMMARAVHWAALRHSAPASRESGARVMMRAPAMVSPAVAIAGMIGAQVRACGGVAA